MAAVRCEPGPLQHADKLTIIEKFMQNDKVFKPSEKRNRQSASMQMKVRKKDSGGFYSNRSAIRIEESPECGNPFVTLDNDTTNNTSMMTAFNSS